MVAVPHVSHLMSMFMTALQSLLPKIHYPYLRLSHPRSRVKKFAMHTVYKSNNKMVPSKRRKLCLQKWFVGHVNRFWSATPHDYANCVNCGNSLEKDGHFCPVLMSSISHVPHHARVRVCVRQSLGVHLGAAA